LKNLGEPKRLKFVTTKDAACPFGTMGCAKLATTPIKSLLN